MRHQRAILSGLILTILFASIAFPRSAQKDGKDAPETFISAARFLEQKPLDKKAKGVRSWATNWIMATDKFKLNFCSMIATGVDKKYKYKYKYLSEIFVQYTIGMAAFKLANPDNANDADATQLAGFESALLSYESIVKEQPNDTQPFLDDLLAKRGQGELAKFVKENNCKGSK